MLVFFCWVDFCKELTEATRIQAWRGHGQAEKRRFRWTAWGHHRGLCVCWLSSGFEASSHGVPWARARARPRFSSSIFCGSLGPDSGSVLLSRVKAEDSFTSCLRLIPHAVPCARSREPLHGKPKGKVLSNNECWRVTVHRARCSRALFTPHRPLRLF